MMLKIFAFVLALCLVGTTWAFYEEEEEQYIDTARLLKEIQFRTAPNAYEPNSTVCFEREGCFSNAVPWNFTFNFLPTHPDDLNTEFLLFTRQNQELELAQLVDYKSAKSVEGTAFDKKLPLKIIIHGFSNNRTSGWIIPMVKALLKKDNLNVILVDWGKGARFPFYNNASSNIRLVGKQIGLFVNDLRRNYYASSPKSLNVHCIGHSLGAHACAYASNAADIRFNRISGNDPAGPFFENGHLLTRLDSDDADFVDVIHTNGGTVLSVAFGIVMPSGHVDYFPNGGRFQSGCAGLTSLIGSLIGGAALDPVDEIGCSHNRVNEIYTESINSDCSFVGFQCLNQTLFDRGDCVTCAGDSCSSFGYNADKFKARGSFYLSTLTEAPFCGYPHLIEMRISSDSPKTAGEISIAVSDVVTSKPKPLTGTSENLEAGASVKRVFVAETNSLSSVDLSFKKKTKPFFGKDPNSETMSIDSVKITLMNGKKIVSDCTKRELKDKTMVQVSLVRGECAARRNPLLRRLQNRKSQQ